MKISGIRRICMFCCLFLLIPNTYGMRLFHRFVAMGDSQGRRENEPTVKAISELQACYQQFVSNSKTKNGDLLTLASVLLDHIKAGQEYRPPASMSEGQKKFVRSRLLTLIFASVRVLKENESTLREFPNSDSVISKISDL